MAFDRRIFANQDDAYETGYDEGADCGYQEGVRESNYVIKTQLGPIKEKIKDRISLDRNVSEQKFLEDLLREIEEIGG